MLTAQAEGLELNCIGLAGVGLMHTMRNVRLFRRANVAGQPLGCAYNVDADADASLEADNLVTLWPPAHSWW